MSAPTNSESSVFKAARYRLRGSHLSEMRRRQFGKTPVNDRINEALREDRRYPVKEMCFGDPSLYRDMGPYDAVHRFLRRYLNFHDDPTACASYSIWGDPQFISQVRRGSANIDEGDIEVPDHVAVYPTSGVAGALRMILPAIILPPSDDGVRDNVIVPKWTYLSHSAEAVFSLGEVRSCNLTRDGQVDLDNMFRVMDRNTRAVMFATVGNPLSTAMPPKLFDEMMSRIHEKMLEFGHPIVVVADTIYEQFRRKREERIDAIQRMLRLGIEVPMIDTSSFSKMFAIPGYRLGFYRALWQPGGMFRDEREDLFVALNTVYGTSLCPVPNIIQKAVGSLYVSIKSRRPVEEELAPLAAVLIAVRDLTEKKGGGDTNTMIPVEVVEDIVSRLGKDPSVWFTSSAVAKRTRKLANEELGKYNVDIDTTKVEEIAERLVEAKMLEKTELEVSSSKMMGILSSAVLKQGSFAQKLSDGLTKGLSEIGMELDAHQTNSVVDHLMKELVSERLSRTELVAGELDDLQRDFGFNSAMTRDEGQTVKLTFYRISPGTKVPQRKRGDDGRISLEGISGEDSWIRIARICGLPTEDSIYETHKATRRMNFEMRTDYFVKELDSMAKEGLGVYLHPSYYDNNGKLHPERLNAFYALFGFDRLQNKPCQAAELVSLCKSYGLPLLMFSPGEVFLPPGERSLDESYIRAVTLDEASDMDEVLDIIRKIATNLSAGDFS